MTLKNKIRIGILLVLTLSATASAVYFWYHRPYINSVEYVNVPQIKEVVKIKRVEVHGPERIVTIEKEKIVTKLSLPEWIRTNTDEQAIATAAIEPYRGQTNAVALLNIKTGVGQIVAKQEPLSLFGFVNDREAGVRAGVNIKGEQETTIYGRYDFFRIGRVHVGVYGDASSTGQAKAQVNIGFKF